MLFTFFRISELVEVNMQLIGIGFWYWAIGWFFALILYCDKCGAYLKCDCNCDDDWFDLDDEYED